MRGGPVERTIRFMSTQTHPPLSNSGTKTTELAVRGSGWLMFATVFIGLVGVLNIVYGIAALQNKQYFNEDGLLWSNLSTWGWVAIIVGAVQVATAWLLYLRKTVGILVAMCFAVFSFIANFLSIGAYPLWSATAMVLCGFVLWALAMNLVDSR